MDEMWILHIKEKEMVEQMRNLHPMKTMISDTELSVSGLVAPTSQSYVHFTALLDSAIDVPKTVRFEL